MPRSRINGNFIDKTSSIVANILLQIILTTSGEKRAFTYYRDGAMMLAQSEGNYVEALQNYYEATRLEIDPYDRSYILYNIGLIHTSNGEHTKALEYYFQAPERGRTLSSTVLGEGTAYSDRGEQAILQGDSEIVEAWLMKLLSIGNKL
ncbi:hypothetical protein BS78_K192300 [Paspalum vaginatum]|uniref:Photosystem I assembly protein Ycf3 n=1 Tax=Paspalum vaginatum TaxID=158149 RepID=A0A9W7X836_9POAL|nr:hypothetical protein BS78_K192300 [Paspalum vaginatum]